MKNITILNGIADENDRDFESQLEAFRDKNLGRFKIDCFTLRKMNIKFCCGCWSCWMKTPGECSQKDDMPEILRSIIHSDLTVFATPIVMGFVSSHIKKVNDKMIPLVHPHIGIYENECHHKKRYESYPKLGLMLLDENTSGSFVGNQTNENQSIITDLYKRLAINMKTQLAFSISGKSNVEVLENEINRI